MRGDSRVLAPETVRHVRALRLGPGDAVLLTDGAGSQRAATLDELGPGRVTIAFTGSSLPDNDSRLDLTLCVALLKRDKLEWVIEKGTELGVTRFVLVVTERSRGEAARIRVDRLERIARAALEQSQRCRLPGIGEPIPFTTAMENLASIEERILFHEDAEPTPGWHERAVPPSSVAAITGPEGGFTSDEARSAAAAGWRTVPLGPRILRAETAAVSAAALLQFLWGDLGGAGPAAHPCRDPEPS